ncbi:hypothetical protein LJR038_003261 [Acidovorax sp. LjRoot38]|uniref:hypothetical protein n=1 Tax=Acidovorax sp. LjRoot38 TaxID=3342327 RepID=UPI003ED0A32F
MNHLTLTYWTNRWGSTTTVHLTPTHKGWEFEAVAHSGPTDFEGVPHFYGNFEQDNVCYPRGIDGYLGFIWKELRDERIDMARAQELMDDIGKWVSEVEQSRPKWRGWNC